MNFICGLILKKFKYQEIPQSKALRDDRVLARQTGIVATLIFHILKRYLDQFGKQF
jgi:hypothetical protein